MKININSERLNADPAQRKNINRNIKNPGIEPQRQLPRGSMNSARERTLVDAVIIAQIAQSYFQKAILISSELRNIAADALTSGKIRGDELADSLNSIRSSLNEIQEFSPQAANTPEKFSAVYQYTGVRVEVPQTGNEFNSLEEIVNGLSEGIEPDLKKIDRIKEYLTNKASVVNDSFTKLKGALSVNGEFYFEMPVNELNQNVIKLISNDSQMALKAQGNINREAVINLVPPF